MSGFLKDLAHEIIALVIVANLLVFGGWIIIFSIKEIKLLF